MADQFKNIGLRGVTVADTKISLVDGENGRLIYRGFKIEDLALNATFEEVVHLLLHGQLPTADELDALKVELRELTVLPEEVIAGLRARKADADPMHVLQGAVAALADHDPEIRSQDRDARVRSALRIVARVPLVVAAWHHIRKGEQPVTPTPGAGLAAAFLEAMWGRTPTDGERALMDTLLVIHAEHTLNASTFAVREVASTRADIYASVAAGIGALSGPLHGGANSRVMNMLEEIGDVANVDAWVRNRIESGQRVMGLGHAVYKTKDPRAGVLSELADKVLAGTAEEKWFRLSQEVERTARALLIELKGLDLYPNVDFYSGGVLRALGIPVDFFPAFFAVSRVAGWTAHFIEEEFAEAAPKAALYRPKANYVGRYCGPQGCRFVPVESRGAGCPAGLDFEGCSEAESVEDTLSAPAKEA